MAIELIKPKDSKYAEDSRVDTRHPSYISMLDTWTLMTDVCVSERHIHEKGEDYLPKLDSMTDTQYAAYVRRAEFPMFTRHTLDSFVGMAMRKDLLIEGIDEKHPFFKNCDGRGTTINAYAEKLVRNFLQYRRCGTLIDMPIADPNQSKAMAEAENVSVRLSFYDHSAILNWKTRTENNINKLTLVVLLEQKDVALNEFEHEYKNVYRVLKIENGIYIQEIYDHDKKLERRIVPMKGGSPLDFIPFTIHGGYSVMSPVMLPIAEQNIHWYMKDADYQHGLHYTALPTPYVTGVDPEDKHRPTTIGPQCMWFLPQGASAGMLEFTGAGLGEISKSMEDTMSNITVLSSQILVPKNTYDETATAASIRSASETASLSSLVSDLSAELTKLVIVASEWGEFSHPDTVVEINSDFIPLTLSGADVSAYVSAVLKEGFSKRTLFELLKKGEIIEGSRQYEDEIADIEKEAQDRMDKEVELARRLSELEAKVSSMYTQNPDSTRTTGQTTADVASPNSNRQNPDE